MAPVTTRELSPNATRELSPITPSEWSPITPSEWSPITTGKSFGEGDSRDIVPDAPDAVQERQEAQRSPSSTPASILSPIRVSWCYDWRDIVLEAVYKYYEARDHFFAWAPTDPLHPSPIVSTSENAASGGGSSERKPWEWWTREPEVETEEEFEDRLYGIRYNAENFFSAWPGFGSEALQSEETAAQASGSQRRSAQAPYSPELAPEVITISSDDEEYEAEESQAPYSSYQPEETAAQASGSKKRRLDSAQAPYSPEEVIPISSDDEDWDSVQSGYQSDDA